VNHGADRFNKFMNRATCSGAALLVVPRRSWLNVGHAARVAL
jgi:hypothetical protein